MESYRIAYGDKISELQKMVNALISEGYNPIGGITDLGYLAEAFTEFKHRKFIVQPMIISSNASLCGCGAEKCSAHKETAATPAPADSSTAPQSAPSNVRP